MAGTKSATTEKQNGLDASRCPGCQQRDATIRTLQQQIKDLKRQLAQTRERLGRNASNSSLPPSSNPPAAPPPSPRKQPSERPSGGQPGHPPTNPGLIPPEQLTEPPIACIPQNCEHCQAKLSGSDTRPCLHQLIELPDIQPILREYQRHLLSCAACGHSTLGSLPAGVPASNYGPRLQAFIALCTGCYHLSKRQTEELLTTTFAIPIALGSICNIEQRVSAALAEPVAQAKQYVQQTDVAHADETSWPQQPDKGWLWVGVTAYLAVFSIRDLRDRDSAQDLLGANFAGVLVSDRYGAYNWVGKRQLCWAHLRRDWQAFVERGGTSRRIGRRLQQLTDTMFHHWYCVRDGTLSHIMFRVYMIDIRSEVADLLRQGAACAQARTAGTCADILRLQDALWTFVDREGVEPTNNAAERALRQAVLWRKKSFGTRGPDGSRYVERILTAVATCRLQGRNVLDYLTLACRAAADRQPAPTLLPTRTQS